jgi:hypothetical protein
MTAPLVAQQAVLPPIVLPPYGFSTLAELMPGIGAHLGVTGCTEDAVGLPPSDRYVVVMIDGLGWHLLRSAVRDIPYLASLLGAAQPITACVPSTTVTSLTSLGTGLPPGQHGLVGYTSRVPSTGEILNALTWESDLLPRAFQSDALRAGSCLGGCRHLGGAGTLSGQRADRGRPARCRLRRLPT